MTGQENVMIVIPKQEWDEHTRKMNELHNAQRKGSPLDGYVSKQHVQEQYGFSDRTWSRLKSKGLIQVKKLGGMQFVKAEDFIQAIETGNIES